MAKLEGIVREKVANMGSDAELANEDDFEIDDFDMND